AAIRWGYYGEEPTQALPFCTDEDMWKFVDCNQGDWDDPVDYTLNALIKGTQTLAQKPVAVDSSDDISSMDGTVENALKLYALRDQLSAAKKAEVEAKLPDAYDFLFKAAPASWLTGADLATVKANLKKLRDAANKKVQELQQRGVISTHTSL